MKKISGKRLLIKKNIYVLCFFACLCLGACGREKSNSSIDRYRRDISVEKNTITSQKDLHSGENIVSAKDLDKVPEYSGNAYVAINNNIPFFNNSEKKRMDAFEKYSELDRLGRCGVAYANVCDEIQPTEERGTIGNVKPSGWHTVKYNDIIDGNYLYNRCHLIGYQLAGENANEKNLITGTRYLNVVGMLPFENEVDDYVDTTNNHVLYRVTPHFKKDNLVVSGVLIEAWSVEDAGTGICFNVYCYNVQPGIEIDYADGESKRSNNTAIDNKSNEKVASYESKRTSEKNGEKDVNSNQNYVWISATGTKYHCRNDCGRMNPDAAEKVTEQEAEKRGLTKCSRCWN